MMLRQNFRESIFYPLVFLCHLVALELSSFLLEIFLLIQFVRFLFGQEAF